MFMNQLPESIRFPGRDESAASVCGCTWTMGIVPSSVGLYSGVALNFTGSRTSTAAGGAAVPGAGGAVVPEAGTGVGAAASSAGAVPVPVAGGGGWALVTNTYLLPHAASTPAHMFAM
jgi:hypothetical protein